jgi:large subunit ribosomal protein L29
MNATDIRKKSGTELTEELIGLRREQFSLRMQQATGQLVRPDQYRNVRKNIARIKTIMREQELQKGKAKAGS